MKRIEFQKQLAKEAEFAITEIITSNKERELIDLSELYKAKEIYGNLTSQALQFFDHSLIDNLNDLFDLADRKSNEDEEMKKNIEKVNSLY